QLRPLELARPRATRRAPSSARKRSVLLRWMRPGRNLLTAVLDTVRGGLARPTARTRGASLDRVAVTTAHGTRLSGTTLSPHRAAASPHLRPSTLRPTFRWSRALLRACRVARTIGPGGNDSADTRRRRGGRPREPVAVGERARAERMKQEPQLERADIGFGTAPGCGTNRGGFGFSAS